jgi:hypothetical protein
MTPELFAIGRTPAGACRDAADVDERGLGYICELLARCRDPEAEVDLLVEKEERRIEPPDLLEDRAPKKHGGAD